ncbi:head GIN domain-containing protein [Pontibacter toksunensis]
MKNIKYLLVLLVLFPLFTSCDSEGLCMKGEGDTETRSLDIAPLEGIDVSGSMRVFIRKGSPQRVEVEGQRNVLDELGTKVQDGVWDIEFNRCIRDHNPVMVYITTPEIRQASVGGSGYVELEDVFESEEFDASVSGSGDMKLRLATNRLNSRISGSGTITAAGVASRHDISISGSGNNQSFDLTTREAEIDISGSGKAEVNVEERMDVEISGSGRVYHQGSPTINADVSGSGKVIRK